MISYSHDTTLVIASIVVSLVASFTGLALTSNISRLADNKRKALIVMSSFVLGGGIWSMHFVAMLAHKLPVPIYYDVLQTLGSALVAILVVGVALLLLHFTNRTALVLTIAGLILGVGVLSMHYIGMLGIRGAVPVFSSASKLLAVIVACVMGVAAIQVAYGRRSKQNILAGSLVMGFSVVAVHYMAMHGTQFQQTTDTAPPGSAVLATGALAVVVTLAVFVICGSFLLAATTFLTTADAAKLKPVTTTSDRAINVPVQTDQMGTALAAGASDQLSIQTTPGKTSGIGLVPGTTSPAPNPPTSMGNSVASVAIPDNYQPIEIPFEKNKKIGFALSDDVAAIRADGHYTHLYTRDGSRFCPWSITEAEKQLSDSGFHRTHRSYLVNVQAVTSFEKQKETGVCRFENYPQLTTVPVSRNRVIGLTDVLGTVV